MADSEQPQHLAPQAASQYERVRARLESEGRWSDAAQGLATAYAEAWMEYRKLTDLIAQSGPVLKDQDTGKVVDHPASRQQRHALIKVQRLAKALRLTDSSPIRRGDESEGAGDSDEFSGGMLGALGRHLLKIERMQDVTGLSPVDLRNLSEARSETLAQQTRLGGVEATAAAELVDRLEQKLPKRGPSRQLLREAVHSLAVAMAAGGKIAMVGSESPASDMLAGVLIPTLEGRKLRAQAEREEAARDLAVGRLISRAEVERGWDAEHIRLRQALERLPEIARLDCEHMDGEAVIEWFDKAIREALEALAELPPGVPVELLDGE